MHKEIIINSSPNEVRVALLEDHEVVEFSMERSDNRRAVGNVYKGVVTAVRPGLQAAFVEIGMEKAGFLHVSDLIHDSPIEDDDSGGRGGRGRPRRHRREGLRPIETMLKEGDEILVQVTKEVIGTKGPRLTADISLPGRFMVLMPKGDHVGVSRKIEDRKERVRLKQILADLKPADEAGAFIIRTAAIGQDAKMIERDMQYLRQLWKSILENAHARKAPNVVHEDVGLIVSLVRDIFKDDIDSVVVDNRDDYQQLMAYVKNFSPDLRDRVHYYDGDLPIFDKYGIEAELKKSLDKKVWMKRGGFLVIEQTEALVAIDVNTGRFTGKKNQAETIFKTNMVAAKEIARQLRLRDVGGIIVLDFIDMESEEDKRRVLQELRTHLKRDRSRTKTFAVSDLGLIEMSRQRVQESLKDRLSDDCPYCHGGGQVLSVDTLSNKVERLLMKLGATGGETAVQVRAAPTLALRLMTERANSIQNIARSVGIRVDVVDDPRLHREEFQIVSLKRRKDLVAEIERASGHPEGRPMPERRAEAEVEHEYADRGDRPERGDRSDRRRRGRGDREEVVARPERGGDERDGRDAREGRDGREGREGRDSRDGRRRRRRDEGAPREEQGMQASRRGPATDETTTDRDGRSRRGRRRGGAEDEAPRTAGNGEDRFALRNAPRAAEVTPTAIGLAEDAEHPADDGSDEARRRRRRRGRRGGRGRRRPDRPDDGQNVAAVAGGVEALPDEEALEVVNVDLDVEETDEAPAREEQGARRERRSRRGRRSGREAELFDDAAASEQAAVAGTDRPAPAADPGPRRRERPATTDRPSPIASAEDYVRPVPEEEYLATMSAQADEGAPEVWEDIEGEADATDSLLAEEEELLAAPSVGRAEEGEDDDDDDNDDVDDVDEVSEAADDSDDDEEGDPRALRRRRRGRRRVAGRPTRLIGTGKKTDDA